MKPTMVKSKTRHRVCIAKSISRISRLKLFACFLLAVSATAGCTSQSILKTAGKPLIRSSTSSGPCFKAAHVIRVDFKQVYADEEKRLLSAESVKRWLYHASVPASMLPPEGKFAHLIVTVEGRALSAKYTEGGGFSLSSTRLYTGARVRITLRLELHNGVTYHRSYTDIDRPQKAISKGGAKRRKNPSDAPFRHLAETTVGKAMACMLAEVFGCDSLISAMVDEDHSIRRWAKYALKNSCPDWQRTEAAQGAIPVLLSTVEDKKNKTVDRELAIQALAMMGPSAQSAIPGLIGILQKESAAKLRYAAVNALEQIGPGDPVILSALIKAFEDESSLVQKASIQAVGRRGPEAGRAVPDLIQVLGEEWPVRNKMAERMLKANVEEALKKITGQDYGKNQEQWQAWWDRSQTRKDDTF